MIMKIEKIKVTNYKVFKNAEIKELPDMCVFLGTNGSGKSTFFDVFGFLSDSLKSNVRTAINKRGGFHEVISRDQKGDIEFEIKFRNEPKDGKKQPIITYILTIGFEENAPIITREVLSYRRGQRGQPYKFLDFSRGKGEAIINEEDFKKGNQDFEAKREKQELDSPDILAIKGLGQFQKFRAITSFRKLLDSWFVSNFNIQASKATQDIGVSEHLSTQGDNLALVAQFMYQNHPDTFNKILKIMKERVPGVAKVDAIETEDGRIVLKFQDGAFKDPFIARYVSDGTLKMFAYLILLNDPDPHPLLCIEEPENYLYPSLLKELAEEFREYSIRGGQVFVSTHSPDFVNSLNIDEVFWITKKDGYSSIQRANEDETVTALYKAGDMLGSLWTQKYFQNSDPK